MESNQRYEETELARLREALPGILPDFLRNQRWFGGKADVIQSVEISDVIPLHAGDPAVYLFLVRIAYSAGHAQEYALPLKIASSGTENPPEGFIKEDPASGPWSAAGILRDAMQEPSFQAFLLQSIRQEAKFQGEAGSVAAFSTPALDRLAGSWEDAALEPSLMRVEQSNTSVRYDDRLILKFFRRLEKGTNPDLEIGEFLGRVRFKNIPPLAGAVEYRRSGNPPVTLAILQGFVPNQGDAWRHTLQSLNQYLERVLRLHQPPPETPATESLPTERDDRQFPVLVRDLIGAYLQDAELLGQRTAELHLALSSDTSDPDFAPEPFTADYQQRLADSMAGFAQQGIQLLRDNFASLPPLAQESAQQIFSLENLILSRFWAMGRSPITACRTRLHGDYHLGQVLYTGTDFVIIDLEGEPERPLAERRFKRSPFRDVTGMFRSFHYAAVTALDQKTAESGVTGEDLRKIDLPAWVRQWRQIVSAAFLNAYVRTAGDNCFMPRSREELKSLLDVYLLEKAIYELIYELKYRPGWVKIPLEGILELLQAG